MAVPSIIFPAEKSVLGLFGRVLPNGDVEYGFLKTDDYGKVRWISQQDAAKERREV